MPSDDFLVPVATGHRKIKPTQLVGFSATNIIKRQAVNNTRGFKVPTSNTDQYRHSFFMRTVKEWNQLSNDKISTGPTSAASTAPVDPRQCLHLPLTNVVFRILASHTIQICIQLYSWH